MLCCHTLFASDKNPREYRVYRCLLIVGDVTFAALVSRTIDKQVQALQQGVEEVAKAGARVLGETTTFIVDKIAEGMVRLQTRQPFFGMTPPVGRIINNRLQD